MTTETGSPDRGERRVQIGVYTALIAGIAVIVLVMTGVVSKVWNGLTATEERKIALTCQAWAEELSATESPAPYTVQFAGDDLPRHAFCVAGFADEIVVELTAQLVADVDEVRALFRESTAGTCGSLGTTMADYPHDAFGCIAHKRNPATTTPEYVSWKVTYVRVYEDEIVELHLTFAETLQMDARATSAGTSVETYLIGIADRMAQTARQLS